MQCLTQGSIVAGLYGPCHVVLRHVIRDVHKYGDAYVLHSQGSLHSNNTVVTVPRFAVKSFPLYSMLSMVNLRRGELIASTRKGSEGK